MKLVYTNLGILTEERVRELRECGSGVDECGMAGSWGDDTEMRGFPEDSEKAPTKVIIIRGTDEDMLDEADTSNPAVGGSVTGTQASISAPYGPAGAQSPSGPGAQSLAQSPSAPPGAQSPSDQAATKEAFNRRAEALLEAWFMEEKKKKLSKKQRKLDINKNKKLDKFDFMALRNIQKKKEKAKKED